MPCCHNKLDRCLSACLAAVLLKQRPMRRPLESTCSGERGSDHSAQEAVVEPEMPATAMAPNASGRHRPRSRLASVALPEPSGSYGLGSSDLTSLDQG